MNEIKYIEVRDIKELENSPQTFTPGTVAYQSEGKKVYYYTDPEHGWKEAPNANLDDMNLNLSLYDLNKSTIAQLPLATEEDKANYALELDEYQDATQANYYMMLCHDYHYYTILHHNHDASAIDGFGVTVLDCLNNTGDLITMEYDKEQKAYEIWMKINDEAYVFYLFNYDIGVVDFA